MKTYKYISATIFLLIVQISVMAQPLPPVDPTNGNSVPVESIVMLLFAALTGLGVTQLRRKKK